MDPITPDSDDSRDLMNLRNQTAGDRVLLFLLALVIGSIPGLAVVSFFFGKADAPATLGGFLVFEIAFSVALLCAFVALWAVFQPSWMVPLVTSVALKAFFLVGLAFAGTATWLLLQWLLANVHPA
jgi:hypothetical protein